MENLAVNESSVACRTSQGGEIRGKLLRLTRHVAAFEIQSVSAVLQTSEALDDFRVVMEDRTVYAGRAVVKSLVDTGLVLVCECILQESFLEEALAPAGGAPGDLRCRFARFFENWQQHYRILPEFKALIADMQCLLSDLRLWLEQVELGIRASPSGDRLLAEQSTAAELGTVAAGTIDALWSRFEPIAARIEPELEGIHCHFLRRHLHSLLLCSPFAYRAFTKPLGYPGDYEVVAMIARNEPEGGSLFAKTVNHWLLQQPPSEAHRNRLNYLYEKLVEVTVRAAAEGRRARIYTLGCGPAVEVQRFLQGTHLADRADFTLVDFNEETLQYAGRRLNELKLRHHRTAAVELIRKSVHQILKEAGRTVERPKATQYDFVYCAGLFDYLPDRVCERLVAIFHEWVRPGGVLLVTNVDTARPFYLSMEYMLDWHLICRSGRQLLDLIPGQLMSEDLQVHSDFTGVNLFAELRKPRHEQAR